MAIYGLVLITLGWLFQFLHVSRKNIKLEPLFLGVYSLGVLILVLDGFSAGLTTTLLLNLISALIALGVLIKIYK